MSISSVFCCFLFSSVFIDGGAATCVSFLLGICMCVSSSHHQPIGLQSYNRPQAQDWPPSNNIHVFSSFSANTVVACLEHHVRSACMSGIKTYYSSVEQLYSTVYYTSVEQNGLGKGAYGFKLMIVVIMRILFPLCSLQVVVKKSTRRGCGVFFVRTGTQPR